MRRWWRIRRARKEQEITARGLLDLHYLAVTFHGRYMLQRICNDAEFNGVDPVILGMYTFFLQNAPVADYALLN